MFTKKNGRMTYKSNRRTTFKRNNNFASKGRNKGNIIQQYNKYLKLAKDTSSSGDTIQAEYYFQFTDHYYRLMLELGINLDENLSQTETKDTASENSNTESKINASSEVINTNEEKTKDNEDNEDNQDNESIESIPFISEPVKKRKVKNNE